MILHRTLLLLRRYLLARKFGVRFTGTTGFNLPESIRLGGRTVKLSLSGQRQVGLDFINLALDDEYGLKSMPFQPQTILDVGANIGLFSLLASHYFPAATIHAYEPNPETYAHTEKNLARPNITAFSAGLGDVAGFANLSDDQDARRVRTQLADSGPIPIESLNAAIARLGGSVDLMKLDCEGAEWQLFTDVESFRRVRVVRMEYHLTEGRTVDDLTAAASRLGFHIDRLEPNDGFGIAWMSRQN